MDAGTSASQAATAATGNGRYATLPPGTRSAAEIRDDVVQQRHELARSVNALRVRWSQATDLSTQVAKHKKGLLIGAAVVGFAIGGAIAFGRRGR